MYENEMEYYGYETRTYCYIYIHVCTHLYLLKHYKSNIPNTTFHFERMPVLAAYRK